jgi:hypothetical protein
METTQSGLSKQSKEILSVPRNQNALMGRMGGNLAPWLGTSKEHKCDETYPMTGGGELE